MQNELYVPDIGDYDQVDIIEVNVAVGDRIEKEQTLITLETDKATMEIPATQAGVVERLAVKEGDKVSEGQLILTVSAAEGGQPAAASEEEHAPEQKASGNNVAAPVTLYVPDIGDYKQVDVIEVNVAAGDVIVKEQTLITLETDKATMEIPATVAGTVASVHLKEGDTVSEGDAMLEVVTGDAVAVAAPERKEAAPSPMKPAPAPAKDAVSAVAPHSGDAHASPAVRRFANQLGVRLAQVTGTGRKGRITQEDVQRWVKQQLTQGAPASAGVSGFDVLPSPKVDFEKFGPTVVEPLSRIKKISGANLHRNWVRIPHVTQFDEADITALEAFRGEQNALAKKQKRDYKMTPLAFLLKASAVALKAFPMFCASLDESGEHLIMKQYVHIGVAVDTPNGLVVPVIRDVDSKGLVQLSQELADVSVRARDGKLSGQDMQGGCFSISSLGGIGGTGFTPIVNMPEVAILGVSRSSTKPQWDGDAFVPRLMLPLSLSYDHRVIDGALAARFTRFLAEQLSDLRNMLL